MKLLYYETKIGFISFLTSYFDQYELRKQKATWYCFVVDYEPEKAKQQAVWRTVHIDASKNGRSK